MKKIDRIAHNGDIREHLRRGWQSHLSALRDAERPSASSQGQLMVAPAKLDDAASWTVNR